MKKLFLFLSLLSTGLSVDAMNKAQQKQAKKQQKAARKLQKEQALYLLIMNEQKRQEDYRNWQIELCKKNGCNQTGSGCPNCQGYWTK